ncbi:MAG: SURF1 family protein [Actinobacteria bacterium]|nr:SURF1 family protein [Actinomycetota bacterium]
MLNPFASRRWILIHIFAAVIVIVCLALALWQLDRLQSRRADNERLLAQTRLPPADLKEAFEPQADDEELDAAVYRTLETSGSYDLSEEVLLRSRSLEGRPGHHLLTPLITDTGTALIVDRGWVPLSVDEPGMGQTAPPAGSVEVAGLLLQSEDKGFLGISDPPPGRVNSLPRVDLTRLEEQMPYPVFPLYLRLQDQRPANSGELPEPAPVPEPDDGPHLSYALQWLFFAFAASVAYGGLIRKERQRLGRREAGDEPTPATG